MNKSDQANSADNIIQQATKSIRRTKDKKHSNLFLDKVYQSMIPIHKVISK